VYRRRHPTQGAFAARSDFVAPPAPIPRQEAAMSTSEPSPATADPVAERSDALSERLWAGSTAMLEIGTVYLGERLGFYRALAAEGSLTAAELAARTGTHERYVREWLEQQAVADILAVDDPGAAPSARRFGFPPGHAEVLTDRDSPRYFEARVAVGLMRPLPAVLAAFRSGGGVPFAAYGADLREGMANVGRVSALQGGRDWLPALPDVQARLAADPPARVAEVGCGAGWACIGLARAFPRVRVDGFDLDEASVELARRNVAEAGLGDRVRIERRDAGDPDLAGRYDLVAVFGSLHDMADPVAALRSMRRLAGADGAVVAGEPRAGERFLDPANDRDVERDFYACSVLHCLPAGMAEQPSAGTGMVMRPDVLRGYAHAAGFRGVEVLAVDDAWTAYYRLLV
jgi:SAM-dependent methyltransferase